MPRPGMILSIIGGDDDDDEAAWSKQYAASPEQKRKLAKVWSLCMQFVNSRPTRPAPSLASSGKFLISPVFLSRKCLRGHKL